MQLGYLETKTLQALRAGPMESWQLIDRLGSSTGLRKLISLGYAKDVEGVYSITQKGKDNCPTRRSTVKTEIAEKIQERVEPVREIEIPVFINAGLTISEVTTMAANKEWPSNKDVIDLVIAKNQILRKDLYSSFPFSGTEYINFMAKKIYSLVKQEVLRSEGDFLHLGIKCNDWLGKKLKPSTKSEKPAKVPDFKLINAHELNKGEPKNEAKPIPKQPQKTTAKSTMDAQAPAAEPQRAVVPKVQAATPQNNQTQVDDGHSSNSVRFAFTNDKCLLLLGIQYVPICFTALQTKELFDFMYSVGMEPDL